MSFITLDGSTEGGVSLDNENTSTFTSSTITSLTLPSVPSSVLRTNVSGLVGSLGLTPLKRPRTSMSGDDLDVADDITAAEVLTLASGYSFAGPAATTAAALQDAMFRIVSGTSNYGRLELGASNAASHYMEGSTNQLSFYRGVYAGTPSLLGQFDALGVFETTNQARINATGGVQLQIPSGGVPLSTAEVELGQATGVESQWRVLQAGSGYTTVYQNALVFRARYGPSAVTADLMTLQWDGTSSAQYMKGPVGVGSAALSTCALFVNSTLAAQAIFRTSTSTNTINATPALNACVQDSTTWTVNSDVADTPQALGLYNTDNSTAVDRFVSMRMTARGDGVFQRAIADIRCVRTTATTGESAVEIACRDTNIGGYTFRTAALFGNKYAWISPNTSTGYVALLSQAAPSSGFKLCVGDAGTSATHSELNGNLTVRGALTTVGATNMGALTCTTLTASGAATLQSTLAVTGASTLAGVSCNTLNASGAATLQSTLNVTGASALGTVTTGGLSCGSLGVVGAATLQSTLAVTGASTLAGLGCTTLNASGAATLQSTLGVTGTSTLAAASCTTLNASGAATLQSTLAVTGASTLAAASCTTLTASGASTLQSTLAVTGASTLAGLGCTTLTASGASTLQSTLAVTGASTLAGLGCTTLTASGAATLQSTLGVTGTSSLAGVNVSSNFTSTSTAPQLFFRPGGVGNTMHISFTQPASADRTVTFPDPTSSNRTVLYTNLAQAATLGDIDCTTCDATGNMNVGGTLGVTGPIVSTAASLQLRFWPGATGTQAYFTVVQPTGGVNRTITFADCGSAHRTVLYTNLAQAATLGAVSLTTLTATTVGAAILVPGSTANTSTSEFWLGTAGGVSGTETQWRVLQAGSSYGGIYERGLVFRGRYGPSGPSFDTMSLQVNAAGTDTLEYHRGPVGIGVGADANIGLLVQTGKTTQLKVVGATLLDGALTVNGNTTLGDSITDTVSIAGACTVTDSLTVNGNCSLGNAISDTVTIAGTCTVTDSLTVNGNATLGNSSADVVQCSGPLTNPLVVHLGSTNGVVSNYATRRYDATQGCEKVAPSNATQTITVTWRMDVQYTFRTCFVIQGRDVIAAASQKPIGITGPFVGQSDICWTARVDLTSPMGVNFASVERVTNGDIYATSNTVSITLVSGFVYDVRIAYGMTGIDASYDADFLVTSYITVPTRNVPSVNTYSVTPSV